MTGLEIYEHMKKLASEIEKNPKWSLAWVLACHVITNAAFFTNDNVIEKIISRSAADLKIEINDMNEAARHIATARRFAKLSKKYGWKPSYAKASEGKGENHETNWGKI